MKLIGTISLLFCATSACAQVMSVDTVQELKLTQPVQRATLAPSGKYVLLSNYDYSGLTKVNLLTNEEEVVSTAPGAGYNATVLDNGDIVYREVTKEPLKRTAIKRYSMKARKSATLVRATRDVVMPQTSAADISVMTNTDFQLELTINGEKRVLSPLGSELRYIWPSISPDGTKILFYASATGAYVCDLDGKNVKEAGIIRAPKWYNDNIIVGQRDKDDGYVTTASNIIARNLATGEEQTLTGENMIAMYPSVSQSGDKILCYSPDGKAYIININVK